ncbi:hypothetical protein LOTGIDRAFT_213219 [Lottia gigantea]|uniref:Uncharacterized protein n=1 Tax=Lottia gigantea TaxID=225164 RepID=V4ARY2_LOTGI|nr:hypothetical protein LOTGIDRAFT_213219 [Lottia gigantea]ESP00013.1 hypothetical protein LOTGIDRAFT_213219 [Lottia gigantea]
MSQFDKIYRSLLFTKFFAKGLGKPEDIKRVLDFRKIVSNRETCKDLVERDYPIHIDKDVAYKDCRIMEGHFTSPFVKYLPGIAPKEVETAHFQMVVPLHWKKSVGLKPVCLQLAGTGDHYYGLRRTLMAKPLINESGIGSIILQNPYYGQRKPSEQMRSSLLYVNDLFIMGLGLILECLALLHWCEREGYGPLGIHGISLGGHMASLAATNWNKPISLIPCLSWSTGSCAFTHGVLSGAVNWNVLQSQYYEDSDYQEIQNRIITPDLNKGAYPLGKQFVKDYPDSLKVVESLSQESKGLEHSEKDSFAKEVNMNLSADAMPISADAVPVVNSYGSRLKSIPQTLKYAASKSKLSVPKMAADATKKLKLNGKKGFSPESMAFLQGVMDECTHLANYSVPVDPRLIIVVAAEKDAYIPRDGLVSLDQLWPGAEIRYINTGHVTSIIFNQSVFRKAIQDSFQRQIKLYYS